MVISVVTLLAASCCLLARDGHASKRAGDWIQPPQAPGAEAVWGIEGGIQVGLWPTPGPRGLFRIYTPYAGAERPRMINFVSVEPVAGGTRGQSELEKGMGSGGSGLEFRTADTLEETPHPREPNRPAAGRITQVDGKEALTVFIVPEPFRNGSQPVIQVILRKDRPREVTFRLFAAKASTPMFSCVLSATMGNYARLRRVWLKDEVAESTMLWPAPVLDKLGFTPWKTWRGNRLLRKGGEAVVAATQDETAPDKAGYDARVAQGWHYRGKKVTQYWRTRDVPGVVARVNARTTYWMSDAPIPGGIAFENFEMEAPFREGQEFTFGVTLDSPEALGFKRR